MWNNLFYACVWVYVPNTVRYRPTCLWLLVMFFPIVRCSKKSNMQKFVYVELSLMPHFCLGEYLINNKIQTSEYLSRVKGGGCLIKSFKNLLQRGFGHLVRLHRSVASKRASCLERTLVGWGHLQTPDLQQLLEEPDLHLRLIQLQQVLPGSRNREKVRLWQWPVIAVVSISPTLPTFLRLWLVQCRFMLQVPGVVIQ